MDGPTIEEKAYRFERGYLYGVVVVEGVRVPFFYKKNWLRQDEDFGVDHFEFFSSYISETGYRSEFVHWKAVEEAGGNKSVARQLVPELREEFLTYVVQKIRERRREVKHEARQKQPALF